jgi:hypothetical protein
MPVSYRSGPLCSDAANLRMIEREQRRRERSGQNRALRYTFDPGCAL